MELCEELLQVISLMLIVFTFEKCVWGLVSAEMFYDPGIMMMLHASCEKYFLMQKLLIFHQPFLLPFLGNRKNQISLLKALHDREVGLLVHLVSQKSYAVSLLWYASKDFTAALPSWIIAVIKLVLYPYITYL